MFRKDLIDLLQGNPMTVTQIVRSVSEPAGQVVDDLRHLLRSLKHIEYRAVIDPAWCRACGFEFSDGKSNKPSKCPKCRSTWVMEPRIGITHKP
jgi:predicted Zn-ribbon and HTH transcriptional regulator